MEVQYSATHRCSLSTRLSHQERDSEKFSSGSQNIEKMSRGDDGALSEIEEDQEMNAHRENHFEKFSL